jgi:Uma2 family endonuclease
MTHPFRDLLDILKRPGAVDPDLRMRLIEALLSPAQPRRMPYDEFLAWNDEDSLAEWVDGVIQMSGPASHRHQEIASFLHQVLSNFSRIHELGEVILPPFQMRLPHSGREPDLIFISRTHLDRLKDNYLDGPADLVVEIMSPESIGRDRGDKFYEYRQAGIPEYWLIDPQSRRVEFYTLDEEGLYTLVHQGGGGIYLSTVLTGFWLKVEWLWQEPPPAIEDVLLEVSGSVYARRLRERLLAHDRFTE